ncbi:MAG: DUF6261 family protein [Bacteroidales bacterium]|jgi:hypothetical protein|nr:DUF6261 family protein [Bacteroidales bacterium]
MINKFPMQNLRSAEHLQFNTDADVIFRKHQAESQRLSPCYNEYSRLVKQEEASMATETGNALIGEKGVAEHYRDKVHSKLFNHVKAILYDDEDPLFDAAQRVMAVIKSVGNPSRLPENAESAVITTLGNKLEPYRTDLEAIGAQPHVDKLLEANRRFIRLETECRAVVAARFLVAQPPVTAVRKQVDPVYRIIVDTINLAVRQQSDEGTHQELIAEMNTLIGKYDALLAQRKGKKKNDEDDENKKNEN